MNLDTQRLKTRLFYADACQAGVALKAIEADAKGDYDKYRHLMNVVKGLHWRIASLRCLQMNDGVLVNEASQCLSTADVYALLEWINLACGTECCGCGSVLDENIPAILT